MKGILIVLVVLLVVLVAMFGFLIKTYNEMVRLRNSVKNSLAQMDTQLQRRFDLIPNLVETVKGYASHERELLENVTASRNGYLNASSEGEKLAMENRLSTGLRNLFAVVENYPELKSNTNFIRMQEELAETEDKVAFSRQFYNDAVTKYNNKLQMFPNVLIASMFGFQEEELFDAEEGSASAPKIKF